MMSREFLYGSFCDPETFDPATVLEHAERYGFASQFVEGKRVLDIGCGSGFGSHILSTAGPREVVGLDISPTAIGLARRRTGNMPYLSFEIGNAYDDLASESFEIVICFELLEHLRHPERVIDNVSSALTNHGLLLASTPNRLARNPGTKLGDPIRNPNHIFEWSPDEFVTALKRRFPVVRLCGQRCMSTEQHARFAKSSANKLAIKLKPVVRAVRRTRLGRQLYDFLRSRVFVREIDHLSAEVQEIPPGTVPLNLIAVCYKAT